MIRVTVWGEYVQESGELREEFLPPGGIPQERKAEFQHFVEETAKKIKEVYPLGITGTIAGYGDYPCQYVYAGIRTAG